MKRVANTVIAIATVVVLAGCAMTTFGYEIEVAKRMCEKHDGLDHMQTFLVTTVVCRDGYAARFQGGGQ